MASQARARMTTILYRNQGGSTKETTTEAGMERNQAMPKAAKRQKKDWGRGRARGGKSGVVSTQVKWCTMMHCLSTFLRLEPMCE